MSHEELIVAMRRISVETGSLACLGCGYEHNCGTSGCAILREAVAKMTELNDFQNSQLAKTLGRVSELERRNSTLLVENERLRNPEAHKEAEA